MNILGLLSKAILFLLGWETSIPKGLLIILRVYPHLIVVYPHTTKWDYFFMLLYMLQHREIYNKVVVLIKEELFKYRIIAYFLRLFGGIPSPSINRKGGGNIDRIIETIMNKGRFIFLISPKGTCDNREWRSGYYVIGSQTNSQFVPVGFNYITHRLEYSQIINGSMEHVERYLKDELASITPLYPYRSEIKLKEYNNVPKVIGWR